MTASAAGEAAAAESRTQWQKRLARRFADRRCDVCGEPAIAVAPGDEADHVADLHRCLKHAQPWPWPSEAPAPSQRRRKRSCAAA